jgi:signal transduction histidine kinase
MEALINGLLQYSRVGRLETPKSQVSVADLLAEIIDSLSPPATFSIEIAPMPTILTEKLPLEQVFTNLIGNAIKHHPRQDGTVKISVREYASNYEFAVADDGDGIAPEYHEKIFGIFQTLSPRDKTESTGIGLAIVKKIVEQQGGTVRLESQPGRGATFYFTWKK